MIYTDCPIYETELIIMRKTIIEDAEDLLNCYSDKNAVPFFNSDNCHGDDFYYTTIERMRQAIEFWDFSYINKYFVRWTIISKNTNKGIGTVEMFHRNTEDEFNHYGVLRIDLQSKYETQAIINEVIDIANENFYGDFNVNSILTKAIPAATDRIAALTEKGYAPLGRKFMIYDSYFVRHS